MVWVTAKGAAVATSTTQPRTSARVHVQKFGTFLSNMVMPNIGAFIAWGLITALFIETGWITQIAENVFNYTGGFGPIEKIGGWGEFDGGGIVGPMITYLLPILIGFTGGRIVYDVRGGVVGAIATMGVIAGTDVPMFMGAMMMGPLGGWSMKHLDKLWDGKIRPGFEMLINNFSAGIWGGVLATLGFFVVGPLVEAFSKVAENVVNFLVNNGLLPLTSIFIEPAKVLFLNNAINHGVLTPLGTNQAAESLGDMDRAIREHGGKGYVFVALESTRSEARPGLVVHREPRLVVRDAQGTELELPILGTVLEHPRSGTFAVLTYTH